MTSTDSKEIAEEYVSSLSDLTINSKPLINMLTMLAGDNVDHASSIVKAVENHLQKVRPDIKLPVLYLIDSIVKNVNGVYLNLFTQNIVNTFCGVFEKVDESTRASMWKLRQTWKDVFPAKKLYSLDVRVQSIDPAWPITAASPVISSGSIHLNPRFLAMNPTTPAPLVPPVKIPPGEPMTQNEAVMREQLLKKQKELLELQKQKIELELRQAKTSLEQQQRQFDKQTASVKSDSILPTAHVAPTTESVQGKPIAPVVPSQVAKQAAKQFPAATASLLKNAGTSNGPRIAPASSLMVASARQVSRDPRLKISTDSSIPPDSRVLRPAKEIANIPVDPQLTTVLSDQLKQQFITKQAVTSTLQKPTSTTSNMNVVESSTTINASSKDSPNNNNNKFLCGNTSKDAIPHHRSSQKKDTRSSLNNISNNSMSPEDSQKLSILSQSISTSVGTMSMTRGIADIGKSAQCRRVDIGREVKNSERGSRNDKSSSKFSSRKVGGKSRSKQPLASPSKMVKVDKDASPVRSKDNSDSSSPNSTRTPPPISKSDSTKNRKKIGKSRKRSPSPPYRIPRRNLDLKVTSASNSAGGLTEEEQSGSLIVSPPHPPTFKEIRPNARQRNYMRRNKEDISSPEILGSSGGEGADNLVEVASKDEDLRAVLPPPIVTQVNDKKEDLDLRMLPPNANKRQSSEHIESASMKKSRAEKFDLLFGNEDVDLRTLTHPKAGRPPTPPPPVISGEENKASWAKIKTPSKNDRDKQSSSDEKEKDRSKDRNKDRLGRPRLYNKLSDDFKDRRRSFPDDDIRSGRRNRDLERPEQSIGMIMKQAEEQFNQGSMSQSDYHEVIQRIWRMNEEEKLKAAQRKEKKIGSNVWEKGLDVGGFSPDSSDMGHRGKDLSHGRNGPRWPQPWQQPGPWAHQAPPPFNPDFRPVGPWQGPRNFGPMRPDFNQFQHGFNANMGPRMNPNLMGGPLNGPILVPGSLVIPPNAINNLNGPSAVLLTNGPPPPVSNLMNHQRNLLPELSSQINEEMPSGNILKDSGIETRIVPSPDPQIIDEIGKDTMRSINIDGIPREIRYYGQTGVVFMSWDDPREIGFQDGIRAILVDDTDTIVCAFNEPYKEFIFENEVHRIRLGAPTRELYVDDRWYECYFGGPPIKVDLGNKKVNIKLEGPPPQVKIGTVKRTDLVVAKISLIINAKDIIPVFLDSKPQMFQIDGQQHTLEFADSLKTVLLNGRSFPVHFGGLPKPITIGDKKQFIRFSVLPKGIRAGHVKIVGMKGDNPTDFEDNQMTNLLPGQNNNNGLRNSMNSMSSLPSFEHDANSQDGNEHPSTLKPDLQLDMLSSALSSAMAPASGLSYQAEQTDKSTNPNNTQINPILPPNLDMNELFQRLVETGIVPMITSETKKSDEEVKKEPEVIPVTFDKPETLKVRQPAVVFALYSGMQCSSCGVRFSPELATKYSQHLDWHFRQNRRERDSARKTHSRPWYYDVNDWIQFEEIEDLEDRAQSWFETEKQSAETAGTNGEEFLQETVQPSVPTGSNEDAQCEVCHDTFEQFYNEEKEEWHLRPAVSFEEKNYHPLCLEDHKRALEKSALALDESMTEMEEEKKEETDELSEKSIEEMNSEEAKLKEEPTTEENPEESKEILAQSEKNIVTETKEEENVEDKKVNDLVPTEDDADNKDDGIIEIEVARKSAEEIESEIVTVDENDFTEVKIKVEPVDSIEGEETFNFDNVAIKTEPVEPEPEPEETVAEAAVVDTTMTAVTSSIDGNVELESAPTAMPSGPSRIKINITKPMTTNKEPEETKENLELEDESVDQTPLPPGPIKTTLQGRKLSVLPPVEKGQEMSGLCSIM